MLEIISLVLNAILSGGLLVTIVTLRQARQKATAEVQEMRLDNTEHAIKILMEHVVEPLQKELKSTRKCVARLTKAVEAATRCPHNDVCPVRHELQDASRSAEDGAPKGDRV